MAECHFLASKRTEGRQRMMVRGSLETRRANSGDPPEKPPPIAYSPWRRRRLGQHRTRARKAFDQGFTLCGEIRDAPCRWGKLWLRVHGDWLDGGLEAARTRSRLLRRAREAYRVAIDHFEAWRQYRLGAGARQLEALDTRRQNDGESRLAARQSAPVRRPRPRAAETLRKAQWVLETCTASSRATARCSTYPELEAVAKSDLPVMVLGESGHRQRELIAREACTQALSGRVGRMGGAQLRHHPGQHARVRIFRT